MNYKLRYIIDDGNGSEHTFHEVDVLPSTEADTCPTDVVTRLHARAMDTQPAAEANLVATLEAEGLECTG